MSEPNPPARHEPDEVNLRAVLVCAGALVAIAVVIHVGAWWLFRYLDAKEARDRPDRFPLAAEERQRREPPRTGPAPPDWSATRGLPPPPPAPRLEGIQRMEGKDVHGRPEWLSEYRWTDRKEGVAQIPLDEAMHLIAERELLPVSPAASAKGPTEPPSRANSGRPRERRGP